MTRHKTRPGSWLRAGAISFSCVALLTACGNSLDAHAHASASGQSKFLRGSLTHGTAAWLITDSGASISTDAGASWRSLSLPQKARTVDVADLAVLDGQRAFAAVVVSGAADLFSTTDGGATWSKLAQLDSTVAPASLKIVLDAQGDVDGVAAKTSLGSNFSDGAFYSKNAAKLWAARTMPVGGDVTDDGSRLWLVGGVQRHDVFSSDDAGATWQRQTPPDDDAAAAYGAALTSQGGVRIPVTYDGDAAMEAVWSFDDAAGTWTQSGRASLENSYGAGVTAPGSVAGDTVIVPFADGSKVAKFDNRGSASTVRSAGLPSSTFQVSFTDASTGWAEAAQTNCTGVKACDETLQIVSTNDGGGSWHSIAAP